MKRILYLLIFLVNIAYSQNIEWETLEIPEGGPCHGILNSPNNNLYAYGANGIFKSSNEGETWKRVFGDYVKYMGVTTNNVLFATVSDNIINQRFLLKSTNDGLTWDSVHSVWDWIKPYVSMYKDGDIYHLDIDRNDNINLTVHNHDKGYAVLRSFDYGENWIKIDTTNSRYYFYNDRFYAINRVPEKLEATIEFFSNGKKCFSGFIDSTIQMAPFDIIYSDSNNIYAHFIKGIYYSSDSGKNWTNIGNENPQEVWLYNFLLLKNNELLIKKANKYELGLYKSANNGKDWVKIETNCFDDTLKIGHTNFMDEQHLLMDKNNNLFVCDLIGIKKSTNGGKYFQLKNKGYFNGPTSIDFTTDTKGNMYYGFNGIYKSIDNGDTWEMIYKSKGGITCMGSLLNGDLLAVEDFNRILYSQDEGESWEIRSEVDVNIEYFKEDIYGNIYAWGNYLYMGISRDGGYTWENMPVDLKDFMAFNSKGEAFSGYKSKLYKSQNEWYSWDVILERDQYGPSNILFENYQRMIFNKKNQTAYFCDSGNYLYKSTDDGNTWNEIPKYIEENNGKKIRNPKFVYGVSNSIDSAGNIWIGLNYTTNSGETWIDTRSSDTRTDYSSRKMIVNSNGYIYWNGLLRLYRSKQPIVSVREKNAENDYFSIFPNPAEEFIEITIDGAHLEGGHHRIEIYDVLGERIISVETRHALSLQRIDVTHLSKGVYFVKIGNITEKFVKM